MNLPSTCDELDIDRLLSLTDLARLFGVSIDSIRRLQQRDEAFPRAIRVVPGRPRWQAGEIRVYLDQAQAAAV